MRAVSCCLSVKLLRTRCLHKAFGIILAETPWKMSGISVLLETVQLTTFTFKRGGGGREITFCFPYPTWFVKCCAILQMPQRQPANTSNSLSLSFSLSLYFIPEVSYLAWQPCALFNQMQTFKLMSQFSVIVGKRTQKNRGRYFQQNKIQRPGIHKGRAQLWNCVFRAINPENVEYSHSLVALVSPNKMERVSSSCLEAHYQHKTKTKRKERKVCVWLALLAIFNMPTLARNYSGESNKRRQAVPLCHHQSHPPSHTGYYHDSDRTGSRWCLTCRVHSHTPLVQIKSITLLEPPACRLITRWQCRPWKKKGQTVA